MTENLPAPDPQADAREHRRLMRRLIRNALISYVVFAIPMLISSGFRAFIGLTCSAAVVMISFLWLEDIVSKVLQPSPQVNPWKLGLWTIARFTGLGVALSVAIFVARFNPISVLLGFSIIVSAIMIEAIYSIFRFGRTD